MNELPLSWTQISIKTINAQAIPSVCHFTL